MALPTVTHQTHGLTPMFIPWSHESVALGTGLESTAISEGTSAFRPSPMFFSTERDSYELEAEEGSSRFRKSESSLAFSSSEHMEFEGSLSAGGSMLGGTGRAQYAQAVVDNRDSNKVSLQSTLRIGLLKPATSFELSLRARLLLSSSPSSFHQTYGDYFLGGYRLGADTSTLLSCSSSINVQAVLKSIQVEGHAFGMSEELYNDRSSSLSGSLDFSITYNGFDTLNGRHTSARAEDRDAFMKLQEEAAQNLAGARMLESRARGVMKDLGVAVGVPVTAQTCKGLCESGLVVELMFLPYSGLKDYVATIQARSRIPDERYL